MCKEDLDVTIGNNIGSITNSRIDQINQIVANISEIPEKFQEPLLLWLELSKEDLLWKKEQRERTLRLEREAQKANRINEKKKILWDRTFLWSKIFFILEIILVVGWYFFTVHSKLPVAVNNNKLIDYLKIIWYDFANFVNKIPQENYIMIPFVFAGFVIIALSISFFCARLIAKRAVRKYEEKHKEDFV